MRYLRMNPELVQSLKNEAADTFVTMMAEGHDGRDLAQVLVEAVAEFAIRETEEQQEVEQLAKHMTEHGQALANRLDEAKQSGFSTTKLMNGH